MTASATPERKTRFGDWSTILGLVGGVVTIISAVASGPPALTCLSFLTVLAMAPFAARWFLKSKKILNTTSMRRVYQSTAILYALVAASLIVPLTRDYFVHDILGFKRGPSVSDVSIVNPPTAGSPKPVQAGSPSPFFNSIKRVRIVIQNPENSRQLAKRLKISSAWHEEPDQCTDRGTFEFSHYEVQGMVKAVKEDSVEEFTGTVTEGITADSGETSSKSGGGAVTVPADGKFSSSGNRCSVGLNSEFQIAFGITVVLEANSFTGMK
jgi:hypothetical protein